MEIVHTKKETRDIIARWRREGKTVGLVPTMGFLHEGHGSLIARSAKENDCTVVSIFVNPMQFSQGEDLEAYPRDMEHDKALCEKLGADLIFNPSPEEMYGQPFYTYTDMTVVTEELCGKTRTNMFRGVCTVVSKLFHIVTPDRAYFGKKDAQQLAVIRKMVEDLDFGLEIVGCESVREPDGLAMSSRNSYLSKEERAVAPAIYRGLVKAKALCEAGEHAVSALQACFSEEIEKANEKTNLGNGPKLAIEYCEVVDALRMKPIAEADGTGNAVMAVAIKLGKARLIDNMEI